MPDFYVTDDLFLASFLVANGDAEYAGPEFNGRPFAVRLTPAPSKETINSFYTDKVVISPIKLSNEYKKIVTAIRNTRPRQKQTGLPAMA